MVRAADRRRCRRPRPRAPAPTRSRRARRASARRPTPGACPRAPAPPRPPPAGPRGRSPRRRGQRLAPKWRDRPWPRRSRLKTSKPARRQVVGEAPRGQVPGVAVLPEAVHEQHRRPRPARSSARALAHHRQRHRAAGDDDFLAERPDLVPVDAAARRCVRGGSRGLARATLPRAPVSSVASRAPALASSASPPSPSRSPRHETPHRLAATLVLVALAVAPLALAQTTRQAQEEGREARGLGVSVDRRARRRRPPPRRRRRPPPADERRRAATKELPATPPERSGTSPTRRRSPRSATTSSACATAATSSRSSSSNLFVDDGATIYSNVVGLELDIAQGRPLDRSSWLTYANYGTGDTLFQQKDKPRRPTTTTRSSTAA